MINDNGILFGGFLSLDGVLGKIIPNASLVGRDASVCRPDGAVNNRRSWRAEVGYQPGDFLHFTNAFLMGLVRELLIHLLNSFQFVSVFRSNVQAPWLALPGMFTPFEKAEVMLVSMPPAQMALHLMPLLW